MKPNVKRIHRYQKNKENTYTVVSNSLIDDTRLSPYAKILLISLLREIDFYQFHLLYYSKKIGLGEKATRKAVNELIQFGYCNKKTITKRIVEYEWFEHPSLNPLLPNGALINRADEELTTPKWSIDYSRLEHSLLPNGVLTTPDWSTNKYLVNTNVNTLSNTSNNKEQILKPDIQMKNYNEEDYNYDELRGFGLDEKLPEENAKRPIEENKKPAPAIQPTLTSEAPKEERTIENIMFYSIKYDLLKVEYENRLDFNKMFKKFLLKIDGDKERDESRLMNRFEAYLKICVQKSPLSSLPKGERSYIQQEKNNSIQQEEVIHFWMNQPEDAKTIYARNFLSLKKKMEMDLKIEEFAFILSKLIQEAGIDKVDKAVQQLKGKISNFNLERKMRELMN